ncbi:hypothetical protein CDAR_87131 [Caerostris darwini]|uniref:Uncharacterized protein n=1 Tax=Caerostris darwini TaxID=1538125 RepID=A0AAV4U7W1_9ARAC|nr:hypothetical protein CDAR_87131 [Caerostris darwini]
MIFQSGTMEVFKTFYTAWLLARLLLAYTSTNIQNETLAALNPNGKEEREGGLRKIDTSLGPSFLNGMVLQSLRIPLLLIFRHCLSGSDGETLSPDMAQGIPHEAFQL